MQKNKEESFNHQDNKKLHKRDGHQYCNSSIKGNLLKEGLDRQYLLGEAKNRSAQSDLNEFLKQSMDIKGILQGKDCPFHSKRNFSGFKSKILITPTPSNNKYKTIEKSSNIKKELQNMTTTYLGNYHIFDYIARTDANLLSKKIMVESLRSKNIVPKIKIALISKVNKRKLTKSGNLSQFAKESCNNNDDRKDTDALNSIKEKKNTRYNETLFLTNPEIINKSKEEDTHEKFKKKLKKNIRKILYERNPYKGYIPRMEIELQEDIRKNDLQVKEILNSLRHLQNVNDKILKRVAFNINDFK